MSLASTTRFLELIQALTKVEHDIIGLAEVKRMGIGIEEHENHIFCFIGETKGLHGLGFLIKKNLKQNIVNFNGISERVALLQMKIDNKALSIIQVYAPTANANDDDINEF